MTAQDSSVSASTAGQNENHTPTAFHADIVAIGKGFSTSILPH
jgi:hypothetical protein